MQISEERIVGFLEEGGAGRGASRRDRTRAGGISVRVCTARRATTSKVTDARSIIFDHGDR